MAASKLDLVFERNATFSKKLRWTSKQKKPANLTGFFAAMQVRDKDDTLLIDASTANGLITITAETGEISIVIPMEVVAACPPVVDAGYDLLMMAPDNTTYRMIEGKARFSQGKTRL